MTVGRMTRSRKSKMRKSVRTWSRVRRKRSRKNAVA